MRQADPHTKNAAAELEFALHRRIQRSEHACRAVPCVHSCFDAGDQLHIVMDAMEGSNLEELLAAGHICGEEDAKALMRRLLDGIDILHSLGIAHNDIKPANLMLKRPGDLDSLYLIDLGLATDLRKSAWMDAACGTPQYFAPELVRAYTLKTVYGPQVDEWAAGVVMHRLLTGELPFTGSDTAALFTQILAHRGKLHNKALPLLSEPAQALLAALLDPSPHKRITARQALRHPWFGGKDRERQPRGRWGALLGRKLAKILQPPAASASTKACQNLELRHQVCNQLTSRLSQSVHAQ